MIPTFYYFVMSRFLALDPFNTGSFTVTRRAPDSDADWLAELISRAMFAVMLVTLAGGLGWAAYQTIKQRSRKRD